MNLLSIVKNRYYSKLLLVKDKGTYLRSAPPILNNQTPLPPCFRKFIFTFLSKDTPKFILLLRNSIQCFGFFEAKSKYELPETGYLSKNI